ATDTWQQSQARGSTAAAWLRCRFASNTAACSAVGVTVCGAVGVDVVVVVTGSPSSHAMPTLRLSCGHSVAKPSSVVCAAVATCSGGLQLKPPSTERLSCRSLRESGSFCSQCTHNAPSLVAVSCGGFAASTT